jgi:hypothetical protein
MRVGSTRSHSQSSLFARRTERHGRNRGLLGLFRHGLEGQRIAGSTDTTDRAPRKHARDWPPTDRQTMEETGMDYPDGSKRSAQGAATLGIAPDKYR